MSELPAGPSGSAGPAAPVTSPEEGLRPRPRLLDQIGSLGLAVLIALGFRAVVVEPFRIPSESMLPTLLIGDHLFVNKFVYGARIPFTELRLPALRPPRRGDVVVFSVARGEHGYHPADRRPELPRERFVKRLVGLPGDRVELREGALWINGEPVEHRALDGGFTDAEGRALERGVEVLDGRPHGVLDDPLRRGPPLAPTRVEPGRYFFLGDNRDDSNDSRVWGTVRLEELKGPAFVLYWSWNWNGSWGELASPATWWELLTAQTRWSRIGDAIE